MVEVLRGPFQSTAPHHCLWAETGETGQWTRMGRLEMIEVEAVKDIRTALYEQYLKQERGRGGSLKKMEGEKT